MTIVNQDGRSIEMENKYDFVYSQKTMLGLLQPLIYIICKIACTLRWTYLDKYRQPHIKTSFYVLYLFLFEEP